MRVARPWRGWLRAAVAVAAVWTLAMVAAGPVADLFAFPRPPLDPARYPPTRAIPLADGTRLALAVFPNPSSPWHVLYFHGNGEDLGETARLLRALSRHASVHAVDYRGYGRSEGRPSVATFASDAIAAYDFVVGQGTVPPERLIVQGYSLGTSAAAQVAAHRPAAGLLLGGAFSSLLAVPRLQTLLPRDILRTDRALPAVACPIRLFHGVDDALIPFAHAERLLAVAPHATLVPLPGKNHRTAHAHDAEQLGAFIRALEADAQ